MTLTKSEQLAPGSPAVPFTLPDTRTGNPVSLDEFTGQAVLLAFICNHCPYVVHLLDAFVQVTSNMAAHGVATIAISANDAAQYPADSPDKMAELAASRGFGFPYCHDESQAVARAYGAVCTPDLFLFDTQHKLYYHGQFDASRPGQGQATGGALNAAVTQLLAQQPVPQNTHPSVGCSIKWK